MGETNDTGIGANAAGASNAGVPPAPPQPPVTPAADEPRILEEHIVAPPPPPKTETLSPQAPVAPEKMERVDLSKPMSLPHTPEAPTEPAREKPNPSTVFQQAQGAITQILAGVKLPERLSPLAPKAPPARTYDTSLTSDPKTPEERADTQARVSSAARAVVESLPESASTADDVRALHTLKDDLQDVVRDSKVSLVRAVALEEEKRHRPTISEQEEAAAAAPRRTAAPILTIFLFLLGAAALGGTYYVLNDRTVTAQAPVTSQILFAEQVVPLSIDGLAAPDIRREIANARNAGTLILGAILQIVPVRSAGPESQAIVSFGDFMSAIGARPPEELVRALSSDFFFGIHTVDENAPLFIIPVVSYERAFAGMLAWEKTINSDLAPMFSAVPMQTVGPDGILVERKFEDTVIRNFDVRTLKDESGTIQLFYSFPTRDFLIIAESQYSFAELLSRLRADRRL